MPRRPTGAAAAPAKPGRRPGPKTLRTGPPSRQRSLSPRGCLVLVVGPSGAGKDSLIAAAKRKFRHDPSIAFPRRTITRPESMGEDHVPVGIRDFERLDKSGAFLLSWRAHGLRYGIPVEVVDDLRAGHVVVVNISRDMVAAACSCWPRTRIVHVTVALDALKARLEARGRESADDIAGRLARAARNKSPPEQATDVIDNSGHLPSAVRKFNALLAGYAEARSKR